jgi:CubicO group peptidase (beta-lactamase class C family)
LAEVISQENRGISTVAVRRKTAIVPVPITSALALSVLLAGSPSQAGWDPITGVAEATDWYVDYSDPNPTPTTYESECPYVPSWETDGAMVYQDDELRDLRYEDFESNLVGPLGACNRTIEQQIDIHQVGGVSVVIIENGEITRHHVYGHRDKKAGLPTTVDTLYQAASMSKFVASLGIMEAKHRGKLSMTESVASLVNGFPDSLLSDWADQNFRGSEEDYLHDITLRRLLNHTAGLDTHSINTAEPGQVPTMRDILLGRGDWGGPGVLPIHEPKRIWDYSGGGYTAAEHILELQIARSFKEFLKDTVLDPAGMTLSSFDKAQTSMDNLARGCSSDHCDYDVRQTNVKAAGGLLANPAEYARLLTIFLNDGADEAGVQVIDSDTIDSVMRPASTADSSNAICHPSRYGDQETTPETLCSGSICWTEYHTETCVAQRWRETIDAWGSYYGLGVFMSEKLAGDGYPRFIWHGGNQTGFANEFRIDRETGTGIVVMVNGTDEWMGDDGIWRGADHLKDAIIRSYLDVYENTELPSSSEALTNWAF